MPFEIDHVDFYRLCANAEMLSKQAGHIHALLSINPSYQLTEEDLTMLKTLTQCTVDYATSILERETSYHE